MASKSDEYYDDNDEEEEDEGDFVPGGDDDDDDDELDADFDDDNLGEDQGDDSPFLSGLLYVDGQGKIVYESPTSTDDDDDQQVFCFTSEEKAPVSWSIQTPVLEESILFAGTLHGQSLKLKVGISEYDTSGPMDSLDERFLKIQDDLQPLYMDDSESEMPARAKADYDEEEGAGSSAIDSKKPARRKAGDDDEEEDSKPISRKPSVPSSSDKHIFVLNAEQTSSDKNGTSRTIRGVFHIPRACSRILVPAALNIHTFEVATAASPSAKASGSVAVAKKRSREDDEDEGDDAVGYQELIDLHDDAGLSTEELRRRYYGGTAAGTSGVDNKKKAKLGSAEEDDDDDAYGF